MLNSGFWANKRVFLTGHTGFKGSWLSFWLQQKGAIVQGYSLAPDTRPSLYDELSFRISAIGPKLPISGTGAASQRVLNRLSRKLFSIWPLNLSSV